MYKISFKSPTLAAARMSHPAMARLHEHKAAGRISVQAVAGHIQMHVEEKVFDLPAGHLLALERAIPHDVEALEHSAFLLPIAWAEEAAKG